MLPRVEGPLTVEKGTPSWDRINRVLKRLEKKKICYSLEQLERIATAAAPRGKQDPKLLDLLLENPDVIVFRRKNKIWAVLKKYAPNDVLFLTAEATE